jgi:hypothetical protein
VGIFCYFDLDKPKKNSGLIVLCKVLIYKKNMKVINVCADLSLALPLGYAVKAAGSSGRVTDAFGVKMLFRQQRLGLPFPLSLLLENYSRGEVGNPDGSNLRHPRIDISRKGKD